MDTAVIEIEKAVNTRLVIKKLARDKHRLVWKKRQ